LSKRGAADHAAARAHGHADSSLHSLCTAALTIADPTNSDIPRDDFRLSKQLPTVRIEVAQPASWTDLVSGLRGLGFSVVVGRAAEATGTVVCVTDGSSCPGGEKSAFVVVARERSVQSLEAAIEAGASGYFVAPLDFHSLSAALCAAANQARDLTALSEQTAKLHETLTADQTVSTVVGILMERYRFQRSEAYERLRRYSRTERRKVVEVAIEIVAATEELGKTMRAIESVATGT
jgi:hypothetical protein